MEGEDDLKSGAEQAANTKAIDGGDDKGQKVHFLHLREMETADFRIDDSATLQSIWTKAYGELGIEHEDRDLLQAAASGKGGTAVSLMPHLGLTLKQARHDKLCDRDFEIAGRTGGA